MADATFVLRAVDKTKKATQSAAGNFARLGGKGGIGGLASAAGVAAAAIGGILAGLTSIGLARQDAEQDFAAITGSIDNEPLVKMADTLSTMFPQDFSQSSTIIGEALAHLGTQIPEETLADFVTSYSALAELDPTADPKTNIEDLAAAMNVFGVPARYAADTLDDMVAIARDAGVPIGTLLDKVSKYGPTFNTAGFSINEAAGFLGILESEGRDLDPIMAGLNLGIKTLASEGVTDIRGGLLDAFHKIRGAKTETEALTTASKLFGSEGAVKIVDAIRNGGIGALEDWTEGMGGALDSTLANKTSLVDLAEATRTESSKIRLAWNGVVAIIAPFAGWFVNNVVAPFLTGLTLFVKFTIGTLIKWGKRVWEVVRDPLANVKDFLSGLIDTITGWELTISIPGFTIPSWIPGLGGKGWDGWSWTGRPFGRGSSASEAAAAGQASFLAGQAEQGGVALGRPELAQGSSWWDGIVEGIVGGWQEGLAEFEQTFGGGAGADVFARAAQITGQSDRDRVLSTSSSGLFVPAGATTSLSEDSLRRYAASGSFYGYLPGGRAPAAGGGGPTINITARVDGDVYGDDDLTDRVIAAVQEGIRSGAIDLRALGVTP